MDDYGRMIGNKNIDIVEILEIPIGKGIEGVDILWRVVMILLLVFFFLLVLLLYYYYYYIIIIIIIIIINIYYYYHFDT